MINNIKNMYKIIIDRNKFYDVIGKEFRMTKASVRVNYFSRFVIPKKNQPLLVNIMQKFIFNESIIYNKEVSVLTEKCVYLSKKNISRLLINNCLIGQYKDGSNSYVLGQKDLENFLNNFV